MEETSRTHQAGAETVAGRPDPLIGGRVRGGQVFLRQEHRRRGSADACSFLRALSALKITRPVHAKAARAPRADRETFNPASRPQPGIEPPGSLGFLGLEVSIRPSSEAKSLLLEGRGIEARSLGRSGCCSSFVAQQESWPHSPIPCGDGARDRRTRRSPREPASPTPQGGGS